MNYNPGAGIYFCFDSKWLFLCYRVALFSQTGAVAFSVNASRRKLFDRRTRVIIIPTWRSGMQLTKKELQKMSRDIGPHAAS